jgi:hypothetical protein
MVGKFSYCTSHLNSSWSTTNHNKGKKTRLFLNIGTALCSFE